MFMKGKLQILALVFLITNGALNAQKMGLVFESGKSFGILPKIHEDIDEPYNNKFTLGTGLSNALLLTIYPDSANYFFIAGFEFFNGASVMSANKKTDVFEFGASRNLKSLRIQTQLAYNFKSKFFDVQMKAGVLLPFYNQLYKESWRTDSVQTIRQKNKLELYPALGFKGGLAINKRLNSKISVFVSGDITLMNAKVKRSKIVEYHSLKYQEVNDAFPNVSSREFVYRKDPQLIRNNEAVLPDNFDKNKATDKLTYTHSINGIALKFGFVFYL
jgi:hypothetical protein